MATEFAMNSDFVVVDVQSISSNLLEHRMMQNAPGPGSTN